MLLTEKKVAINNIIMTEVCLICDYDMNESTRKKVGCEYCEFHACATCCKTYILGETRPKCMNGSCDKEWSRKFLTRTFGLSFVNSKLKQHREQVLFDKERALLPATQPIVEGIIEKEDLKKEALNISLEINRLQRERYRINDRIRAIDENLQNANGTQDVERPIFTRGCPDGECRGFLSTQWKCGLCSKWACAECHEIKGMTRDAEHTCNPDNLATARLLANDTKPCPKCSTQIFKIDGCDQMWCTQCHTAFSWRTGALENAIHNPHYYQWLRSQSVTGEIPRNAGNPCEAEPFNQRTLMSMIATIDVRHNGKTDPNMKKLKANLLKLMENLLHLHHVELHNYRDVDYMMRNQELRVRYMRQEIDEKQFKMSLQRNEKKVQKRTEMRNVIQLLDETAIHIILRFKRHIETCRNYEVEQTILSELDALVKYVNENLAEIDETYGSTKKTQVDVNLRLQ
jgi:hypothetical protein